jgi:putative glutamine amidotransferase
VKHLRPGTTSSTRGLDGVVISGGHDVEPTLYKKAAEVEGKYDPERDAFESEVIDRALADDTPLLGICRGAQLLNVRLGGTLFQDLRAQRVKTSNRRTVFPLKTLCLERSSQLRELMRVDVARINSLHKQSIDHLGEGLRISGRDLDGIVQAVESEKRRFLWGVQWHPELLFYVPKQLRIFRELTQASREYRKKKGGMAT